MDSVSQSLPRRRTGEIRRAAPSGIHPRRRFAQGRAHARRIRRRVRRSFEIWKRRGQKIDRQFRFLERIAKGAQASERGIYRFALTSPDGRTQEFFGQFHTFARKVDGRWQFIVDYGSDEGGTVEAAKYLAAAAVDDFSRF